MRHRILIVPALLCALLLGGCGGSSSTSAAGSSTSAASSGTSATASEACPTANTTSFAKTRFVADVGGSLFLMNRYVLKPYQAGTFKKGASGRTFAIVKAGLAAATTAKLLKNAAANAKANPTLCRSVAAPLNRLSDALSGAVSSLTSGTLDTSALAGLGALVSSVKSGAAKAGIPLTEKQMSLG